MSKRSLIRPWYKRCARILAGRTREGATWPGRGGLPSPAREDAGAPLGTHYSNVVCFALVFIAGLVLAIAFGAASAHRRDL